MNKFRKSDDVLCNDWRDKPDVWRPGCNPRRLHSQNQTFSSWCVINQRPITALSVVIETRPSWAADVTGCQVTSGEWDISRRSALIVSNDNCDWDTNSDFLKLKNGEKRNYKDVFQYFLWPERLWYIEVRVHFSRSWLNSILVCFWVETLLSIYNVSSMSSSCEESG